MKYILTILTFLVLTSCDEEIPVDPFAISDRARDSIYIKVQEFYAAQKYSDAEKILSTIRARHIYDHGYFYLSAKVKFNLQKYSEAIHYINRALRVNDKNASIYFIKANCYANLNLMDTAMICLHKAISL